MANAGCASEATDEQGKFARLLRTGIAAGDRTLAHISEYARNHLTHLTDAEIAALYSDLHALPPAAKSTAPGVPGC